MSDITRTVFLDNGEQRLELQKYRLEVLDGPNKGESKTFEGRRVTLGTSPETDMSLDDPTISRFHAKIEVVQGGYLLRDMESKNGSSVHGLKIREVFLNSGTTFKLGKTQLRFDLTSELTQVHFSGQDTFGSLLGKSLGMREIFSLLGRVAPTDHTILVEGESGTGKELIAEAVHQHSKRSGGPFVVVDCSAIARDLIESELFGHVKGAFTGATASREGAFAAAKGGTLFLDELGELPLDLQPKLLRVLENRKFKPVGSNDMVQSDARIVAATNRTLLHEVREGNFREDLYYRFAVIKVGLPPLRERREDIPMLVDHFLVRAKEMAGRSDIDISYKTMEKLQQHGWPGNVRELRNFVERAVLLAQGSAIETKYLNTHELHKQEERVSDLEQTAEPLAQQAIDDGMPFKDAKNRLIEEFEHSYWSSLLERTGGNVSKAARIAGVHRKSVEYILKKLDLTRDSQ